MKSIEKLLARNSSKPAKGQRPELSAWTPVHTFSLQGGALQFTEARVLGLRGNNEHECYEVTVPNGDYRVECRVARYGGDARIAGLRALPIRAKIDSLSRGEKIKNLPVDMGGIAVVDIGGVHASMQDDEERYEEWLEEILFGDSAGPVAIHTWKPTKTKILIVESGFGDGSYPLYPLKSGAEIVGLEVEFIGPDVTYPF